LIEDDAPPKNGVVHDFGEPAWDPSAHSDLRKLQNWSVVCETEFVKLAIGTSGIVECGAPALVDDAKERLVLKWDSSILQTEGELVVDALLASSLFLKAHENPSCCYQTTKIAVNCALKHTKFNVRPFSSRIHPPFFHPSFPFF
jgi:hypothetical protein